MDAISEPPLEFTLSEGRSGSGPTEREGVAVDNAGDGASVERGATGLRRKEQERISFSSIRDRRDGFRTPSWLGARPARSYQAFPVLP